MSCFVKNLMSAFLSYLKDTIFFCSSAVNVWFWKFASAHPGCKHLWEVCECAFSRAAETTGGDAVKTLWQLVEEALSIYLLSQQGALLVCSEWENNVQWEHSIFLWLTLQASHLYSLVFFKCCAYDGSFPVLKSSVVWVISLFKFQTNF